MQVPGDPQSASGKVVPFGGGAGGPSPTDLMIAAAIMHQQGKFKKKDGTEGA